MTQENAGENKPAESDLNIAGTVNTGTVLRIQQTSDIPLFTITREQGTVGIKFDPAHLRSLALTEDKGKEAYSLLSEAMSARGISVEHFHTVLHELLEGTINAFHRNAYAFALQSNPSGAAVLMQESDNVG